ncbi:2-hydroxyacid dehydrogenase [Streptomyces sp. NPDC057580]|uniref:2-hydroxyacid dehydrogenase n=1 Tax=Streptomyces sp. NPDC057580 TaxID=3346173 RepID=UPI00367F99E1
MTRPRLRVVLTRPLADPAAQAWLDERAEVRMPGAAEVAAELRDADGLIAVWPFRITARMLEQAPGLRAIATVTAGSDHVDCAAAARLGIAVITGAGAAPTPVVEYVLWAAIGLHRRFHELGQRLADGTPDWPGRFGSLTANEVHGQTLGIVGFGHIGQSLAALATRAFGMKVLVYDPYVSPVALPPGVLPTDLTELLNASSTVSLNLPLTQETRGLIGRQELRRIGSEGVLVNAARGGVVDESALLAALEAGELGGAALDVFESEPPSGERIAALVRTGRVVVTPHAAGFSRQAAAALSRTAVQRLIGHLNADMTKDLDI